MARKLWEVLVDHASRVAGDPAADRGRPRRAADELSALAGDDVEAVDTAWEHCVTRYTEGHDTAWLRVAARLEPVSLQLHKDRLCFAQPLKQPRPLRHPSS